MHHEKISLKTAILLNINIMIGSGILIGPSRIAQVAGNASFLAWPVVALLFLPLVLCTVQLSRMFPGCGGFYSYAKSGINTAAGFASGWLYVMGYAFCIAIGVMALREFCLPWIQTAPLTFYIPCLAAFFVFNLLGLRLLSAILNSLTITKIVPLVALILLLPLVINFDYTISAAAISAVPMSLPLAMFGFFGFEACCSISHLIENAERNAPRAIAYGFMITAALYTLFHFGLLQVMGAENLAKYGAPAFVNYLDLPIPYLASLLGLLIPISAVLTVIASANGLLNANSIMLHSLASEGIFKGSHLLAKTTGNNRPWAAILLQIVLVFILLITIQDMGIIASLCVFSVFLAFILPFLSLLILQKKKQAFKHMALTIIALIFVIALAAYSWYTLGTNIVDRCIYSLPLIAVMLAGYFLYTGEARRSQ